MSTQAMEENLPDSNAHPAPRTESQQQTQKVMTFHLYDPDVSTSLLKGITLSPCQLNTEIDGVIDMPDDDQQNTTNSPETDVYTVSTKMACSLCNCLFTSRQLQTDHYKLDWHRFNLKQKLMRAEPVTEDNFEKISGDVSSISGSDSSTDSDSDDVSGSHSRQTSNQSDRSRWVKTTSNNVRGRGHPKVFFRSGNGKLVSVHRCILYGKKNAPATQQELVAMAMQLPTRMKWLILMIGGGHFAGAVFDGKEIVSHKTFHRYTVRAKRGTAQGMRDSQQGGNQPKSAGASLRRYNEAALVEDIQTLFASWADSVNSCHRIFLRAPSYNKKVFFGGKNPLLDLKDERIVTIPFATRRPTFKEIRRVHELLTSVECYGDANEAEKRFMAMFSPKTSQPKNTTKVTVNKDEKFEKENDVTKPSPLREDKENRPEVITDGEGDVELVMLEEEISTLDLQEFETRITKPKRTKKKKKPKKKQEAEDGKPSGKMETLCEACRQGDWDRLQGLLMTLRVDETILDGAEEQSEETPGTVDAREEKRGFWDADFETATLEVASQDKTAAGLVSSIVHSEDDVVRKPTQDDTLKNVGLPESTSEQCMMGKEQGMMGKEQGMMGKDKGMMGKDKGMMGNDQGMMGNDQGMVGSDQGMMGNEQGMMGKNQGMMGNDQGMMGNEQGMMGKNQGMVGNDQGMMGNEQGMMGKNQGMMGNDQGMVGNEQGMMGKNQGMVGSDQGMMGNEQGMVDNNQVMTDLKDAAAIVNCPVDDAGGTLLHVAAVAEQATMVWNLLDIGADPAIKNKKGQPPYVLCSNKEIRKEFRRYMAAHPEKYDYEKSQIPSPLTSDLEELRATKAAEKRRIQKKNKRIRDKEQKQELKQQEEEQRKRDLEQEERRRFAALTDREKRAIAAERRLNAQLTSQNPTGTATLTNTQRCWLCGNSLAGKVPFEYLDYKFCTIDCVKAHKQQQKNAKS
ncbi:tRNA endonuclease ANKZF1-like [Asterias amurensis]|uniref:tRNA endonuclease ANKZF1-like n=1 Tax=Asterias amurensis TaxID=7602 RepID=UPI003AB1900A